MIAFSSPVATVAIITVSPRVPVGAIYAIRLPSGDMLIWRTSSRAPKRSAASLAAPACDAVDSSAKPAQYAYFISPPECPHREISLGDEGRKAGLYVLR
ncbi:hypothetical protein [Sphingomonas sp. NFR15]|uniref:hypothetical protein n=1 Tax=Sphingomonas sp. NFR15 TaxID=1566282 RepID=UPI00210A45C2|nr:hypothetical protein [Sphingomonas sp. NFR15]